MPERFDIAVLLETADERSIRSDFFNRLRVQLAQWIGTPREFMLLGPNRDEHGPWTKDLSLSDYALHDDDQLFVYCDIPGHEGQAIFGIVRGEQTAVYGLSLPLHVVAPDMQPNPAALLDIYCEIAALNLRGLVAAGKELALFPSDGSVHAVLSSVNELGSLIDFICCSVVETVGLFGFVLIQERGGGRVYRRR